MSISLAPFRERVESWARIADADVELSFNEGWGVTLTAEATIYRPRLRLVTGPQHSIEAAYESVAGLLGVAGESEFWVR